MSSSACENINSYQPSYRLSSFAVAVAALRVFFISHFLFAARRTDKGKELSLLYSVAQEVVPYLNRLSYSADRRNVIVISDILQENYTNKFLFIFLFVLANQLFFLCTIFSGFSPLAGTERTTQAICERIFCEWSQEGKIRFCEIKVEIAVQILNRTFFREEGKPKINTRKTDET